MCSFLFSFMIELIKVTSISDIKLYDGPIDKEDLTIDYHLDFVNYLSKDVPEIVKAFLLIKEKATYSFHIIVDAENRNFNEAEFGFFFELESKLNKHGLVLSFDGGYKNDYTLTELLQADTLLDSLINKINSSDFSPFEKYIFIYHYLAGKKYKDEDVLGEDIYKPRDIIAVMNSDYIVCEGYSRLMKYLCDNVGITCICQLLKNNDDQEKHMNNLVYLDDNQYDIHGLYYSDVTWDNIGNDRNHTFTFCLIPIEDVDKIRLKLVFDPFYMFFYNPKKAALRVIDSDALSLIGEQVSPSFYLPSLAEDLFDIKEEIEKSYDMALKFFLKRRKEALNRVKEMFLEKNVPSDAYDRHFLTPFGSSLPFLIATLCYNTQAESVVENGINRLLRHYEKPLDGEGEIFEGEEMPFYRTNNLYLTLDALSELSDEDIDHPLDELKKISDDFYKQEFQTEDSFDVWIAHKKVYENLLLIIHKLRNMLLYRHVQDLIAEKFPHGEPIRLISFFRALEKIYSFEGFNDKYVLKEIRKYLLDSTHLAKRVFEDGATNCFKNNDEGI